MMNYYLPAQIALIFCCLVTVSGMAQTTARNATVMSSGDATALSEALTAYNDDNEVVAIPALERLAAKYPDNFPANEALGLIYADGGNFARALPYLEHAANAKKENTIAQANLGAAYLKVGDIKAAVQALKRAVALDAKNDQTLSNLGHALFLDNQPQAAANVFAKASAIEPDNMDVRFDWALALHESQNDASALEILQQIPAGQRNEAVESLWGETAEKHGQFKEAADHMQAAMKLNPSEQNVYVLTLELLRHWTWQPATEIATYGVKNFPDSRRLQLAQAIAFYGGKHYVDAAAAFSSLLSLDPDNESYGDLLGKSCSALGWSGATQCDTMIDFADKHPANAQVAVYAASNILHNSDPDAKDKLDHAERLLVQSIRVDPKIAEAYCELGTLQQERSQWSESVVNLNKAVELHPAFPAAHYRLARAYAHLHQLALADKERALLLKYDQQVQDDSRAIIREVTMFLVASH